MPYSMRSRCSPTRLMFSLARWGSDMATTKAALILEQMQAAKAMERAEVQMLLRANPGARIVQDEVILPPKSVPFPSFPDPHPTTGRRTVAVEEWANRPDALTDSYAYWYVAAAEGMGLEPWRLIEGIDAHVAGGLFDVLFVGSGYRTVPGSHPIYVKPKDFEALKCGS